VNVDQTSQGLLQLGADRPQCEKAVICRDEVDDHIHVALGHLGSAGDRAGHHQLSDSEPLDDRKDLGAAPAELGEVLPLRAEHWVLERATVKRIEGSPHVSKRLVFIV